MASKETAIRARIEGDGKDFRNALEMAEHDAKAWAVRMRAYQAANSGALAGAGRGGRGVNVGQGMLELSRGVEDAQYGIKGILNNIPVLMMALGASGGLAGAVSIAAVAFSVFGKDLMDFSEEKIQFAKQRLQELDAQLQKRIAQKAIEELAAAQKKLADGTTKANDTFKDQITYLEQAAALAKAVAASRTALANAEIDYANGTESEKIIAKYKIENDAAQAAHDAALKQIREERAANEERLAAMYKIGAKARDINEVHREAIKLNNRQNIEQQTFTDQQLARDLKMAGSIERIAEAEAEKDAEDRQRAIDRVDRFEDEQRKKEAAYEREEESKKRDKALNDATTDAKGRIGELRRQRRFVAADRLERELESDATGRPVRNYGRRGRRIDASAHPDLDAALDGVGGSSKRKRSPHAEKVHQARIEKAEGGAGAWINKLDRTVDKFDKAVDAMTGKAKSEPLRRQ